MFGSLSLHPAVTLYVPVKVNTFRQLKALKKSAFIHLTYMDEKTMIEAD